MKTAPIDILRQKMIAEGMTADMAGIAVGLAAEYAQKAYMQGYNKGFENGVADTLQNAKRKQT